MNITALLELVHKNQFRKTGDKYTTHLYAVRKTLEDGGIYDQDILNAALLHDILEDSELTKEYLELWFGERIANIVFHLSKTRKGIWNTNYCRLHGYFTMLEEFLHNYPEVILIKMADRIHNLQTAYVFPKEKLNEYINETEEILLPLFNQAIQTSKSSEFRDQCNRLLKQILDLVIKLKEFNISRTE